MGFAHFELKLNVYHFGPAVAGDFAFVTGPSSSIELILGGSYGVRDAWNNVAMGINFYPFSEQGKGIFVDLGGAYGFDVSSVQGNSGTDWRASMLIGYRVIFDFFTGSIAARLNEDVVQNDPLCAVAGISPAVSLSVGLALGSE